MTKDSFVIYTKFGEQVSLLSDAQAGILFRALIAYQSENELPKMDGMTNIVFSVIRQQIDFDNNKYQEVCNTNKTNGQLGGRPRKTLTDKGNKPKKPSGFESEENKPSGFSKNRTKPKKPESDTDNDTDTDNNITPIIPYEGKGDGLREKFFKTYPSFKGEKRCDDSGVDYGVLLAEFEKSRVLQGMYSFAKVCGMYEAIARGDFRDKEQPTKAADGFEARTKRERWYALRREKAISQAEKVRERFMQDETFAKIYKRLSAIEVEQAKAEVQGDKQKLAKLEQEKNRLRQQKRGIIERNGLTEEDLEPKWSCRKCQDTGFVNGVGCDCYEG